MKWEVDMDWSPKTVGNVVIVIYQAQIGPGCFDYKVVLAREGATESVSTERDRETTFLVAWATFAALEALAALGGLK